METMGKSSNSPFELIAPGRTLTVIVPSREAETHHAGVPAGASRLHRDLIRRFAEEHYLDATWVQVENPAGYRMVERPVEFTEKCVDPTRQVPPIRPSSVRSPNAGG